MSKELLTRIGLLVLAALALWVIVGSHWNPPPGSSALHDQSGSGSRPWSIDDVDSSPPGLKGARDGGLQRSSEDGVDVPPRRHVQGRVVRAADEHPLAGASVILRTAAASTPLSTGGPSEDQVVQRGTCDDSGEFSFSVAGDLRYTIEAHSSGYAVSRSEPLWPGQYLTLALHAQVGFTGVVTDARGRGVVDARVHFRPAQSATGIGGWRPKVVASASTGAEGDFRVTLGQKSRYQVSVVHPMYPTLHAEVWSHEQPYRFELLPGKSVTGKVVSGVDGDPVSGAWFRAYRGAPTVAVSGVDGTVVLQGVAGDQTLLVGAAGYASRSVRVSGSTDEFQVELAAARIATGVVCDEQSRPLAGVRVIVAQYSVRGVPIGRVVTRSSDDGSFEVADCVEEGVLVVACRDQGLAGSDAVEIPRGTTPVNLGTLTVLGAEHELEGGLRGLSTSERAILTLARTGGAEEQSARPRAASRLLAHFRTLVAFADSRGSFRFVGLAPGHYSLRVHAPGRPERSVAVRVPRGEPLTIEYAGDQEIRGAIVDGEGKSGVGLFCSAGHGWGSASSDADGKFTIFGRSLAPKATVEIRSVGDSTTESRVLLRESVEISADEHVFRIPGPSDVSGVVSLDNKHQYGGYEVQAFVDGKAVASAAGDENGFVLRDLPTGGMHILATKRSRVGTVLWQAEAVGVSRGDHEVVLLPK